MDANPPIYLSIVIPIYNEEENIPALWERLSRVLAEHFADPAKPWEVILTDDGSRDGTATAIRRAAAKDPAHVHPVYVAVNSGKGNALKRGLVTAMMKKFVGNDYEQGLKNLKEKCDVTLYSDSQYVVNGIEKGWAAKWRANGWIKSDKSPALNTDLWDELLHLVALHKVSLVWVKGHAGHPENERCDALAVAAAHKFK